MRQTPNIALRMIRYFAYILFVFVAGVLQAQGLSEVDSLRRQLAAIPKSDTLYVMNLMYLWIAEGKSDPVNAERDAGLALEYSRKLGWQRGEINALNAMALTKQRQGYFTEAMRYYMPALALSEQSGNSRHISKTNNNLGILYQITNNYPKAIDHFKRVLEVEKRPLDRAFALNNIGIVLKAMGQLDSALYYYQIAKSAYETGHYPQGIAPVNNNIGVVLRIKGRLPEALHSFREALVLYRKLGDVESSARTLANIGSALTADKQYQAAYDSLMLALPMAQSQKALVTQMDITQYLHELFSQKGEYAKAYEWLGKHKIISDSLRKVQLQDELETVRRNFERDQKLTLLEKDVQLERMKNTIWSAFTIGLVALLLLSLFALFQTRKRRKAEASAQEKEIARFRAEELARDLRETILQEDLAHKSRELASQTLHLVQKNELLQSVAEQLSDVGKMPSSNGGQLRSIQRMVVSNLNDAEQWAVFKRHFEAVHPEYFQRLLQQYPQLTAHDLRYCAYLRMNLSTKDIAALLNITIRGVETHRHRLRKKLQMEGDRDLVAWAMQV